ncbi:Flp pilus assembly complex ATPase component TadA [Candidatus Woesebacteria bacterium]|nr:MAG: Flp pilus assembly complex ATPase component TadA [Candidatus Woesebacteria bacterium]
MTAQTNTFPDSVDTKTLADILADQGVINSDKAKQIKFTEIQTGKPQEEIIKTQNIVSESDLTKAKAALYNIPYLDLSTVPTSPEALSKLPKTVAERFRAFPVSIDSVNNLINVAMADPLDLTAIEFIEQRTGFMVKPYAADPTTVENLIATGYSSTLAREVTAALKDVSPGATQVRMMDTSRTGVIREEKVAEIVTHILSFAMKARASDVHIEPQEYATRVRYRIDGILQEKLTTPRELHEALVSRIKILSGLKIDEKRIPQDGRFNFRSEDQEVDLRVSSLPTTWGEKIVMRLLKKTGGVPDLPDLGLRGRALKNLEDAILRPHGIILICGPTGSGKTTTLYSIIQRINTPKINIVTLEDPIEYKIQGVNQVQVNPGAGLTFASGLRSFLRQDPNVILVGEIRDQETADLAIQASLTGHLVFATLHTNDAAGALPRLLDMGAEPYLLSSSMTAIVAQRVVRKIDENSKEEDHPSPKAIEDMKNELGTLWPKDKKIIYYKGLPTKENNNTGYHGRMGVFEVLPVTEKISRLILERSAAGAINKVAVEEGMITMKQDGYLKVLEGTTTLEEVLRVAQE